MSTSTRSKGRRLVLEKQLAGDLMSANPVSIRSDASVVEATSLLTDRGFHAAPVIDDAGRPVGVVSKADLLVHDRERFTHLSPDKERSLPEGFEIEDVDPTTVEEIMTPAVFSVSLDTPASSVVEQMLTLNVHQLFVVDADGLLVGVISTFDVFRRLRPEE